MRNSNKFCGIFSSLYDTLKWETCDSQNCAEKQIAYKTLLDEAKNKITAMTSWEIVELINKAMVLEVWDSHKSLAWKLWTETYSSEKWLDVDNELTWKWNTYQLHDLLKWNSYVVVFSALYASLLNDWKNVI